MFKKLYDAEPSCDIAVAEANRVISIVRYILIEVIFEVSHIDVINNNYNVANGHCIIYFDRFLRLLLKL